MMIRNYRAPMPNVALLPHCYIQVVKIPQDVEKQNIISFFCKILLLI